MTENSAYGHDPHEPVPGTREPGPGSRPQFDAATGEPITYAEGAQFDPESGEPLNDAARNLRAANDQRNASRPTSGADAMLRSGREGEAYREPPARLEGEGVETGPPHDHYVHLADGSVITGHAGGSHVHDPAKGLIPVVSVFPMGGASE